ncbi:hypothetical protein OH492_04320 [Vibrio chagasii]|nr:hypothetical protein [Vibrio chagasii]
MPVSNSALTLASADPTDLQAEDDFRFATGLQIERWQSPITPELEGAIRKLYGPLFPDKTPSARSPKMNWLTLVEVA